MHQYLASFLERHGRAMSWTFLVLIEKTKRQQCIRYHSDPSFTFVAGWQHVKQRLSHVASIRHFDIGRVFDSDSIYVSLPALSGKPICSLSHDPSKVRVAAQTNSCHRVSIKENEDVEKLSRFGDMIEKLRVVGLVSSA